MTLAELLDSLFPTGHRTTVESGVIAGAGTRVRGDVALIGTVDHAPIGVDTALALASHVLRVVQEKPRMPILLLVDNAGQRLSRRDELFGNNGYLAHLAKCLEVARARGHRVLSLVYDQAVSGGFLAAGMIADRTYALPDARIHVMNLPAMSRITQIPLDRLETLCANSAVFAPGVPSFHKLGIVEGVWDGDLAAALEDALEASSNEDTRSETGRARGGRMLAADIVGRVLEAAA
ncbi:biotin-independent malonate decarboxylase subunit gamma [Paraburkholderia tuberum]|uniref:Malonate decarboxylase gamma subunit n=1 Tax=Paraburkholderia tuberum TaxID=157910 RepID=A0A1H1KFX8_9BURK|nr:biotin-independent malonate decarboxylase subunit gamma [Paraburkholderia tuberum]SDR61136.1 malonate decarboxylase gamma subunit [Paraburkholderia tuberum]